MVCDWCKSPQRISTVEPTTIRREHRRRAGQAADWWIVRTRKSYPDTTRRRHIFHTWSVCDIDLAPRTPRILGSTRLSRWIRAADRSIWWEKKKDSSTNTWFWPLLPVFPIPGRHPVQENMWGVLIFLRFYYIAPWTRPTPDGRAGSTDLGRRTRPEGYEHSEAKHEHS